MKKERDYVARLVIYGLDTMSAKDYKRLLVWLEKRHEEAQKPEYRKKYASRYTSKLMK